MRFNKRHRYQFTILTVFQLLFNAQLYSQQNVEKTYVFSSDSVQFDTVSIDPASFSVYDGSALIDSKLYTLYPLNSILVWRTSDYPNNALLKYKTLSLNFNNDFVHKDSSFLLDERDGSPILYSANSSSMSIFNTGGVRKSGSISRGVLFGNNQNLSLNSNLNLQLEGNVSDELSIRASVSDNNLPIQPDGNTQQLQDFDQVYIQLFASTWKLTAGDFWLQRKNDYFLKYYKRAQGLSYFTQNKNNQTNTRISAAISKGKFSRNIIQGVEGNQGPYKLVGNEKEPFIIVLSGTEQVFIDGKLLVRGQENDYTINYNTAEVVFTANQIITKDKRIVVSFQYSDKNYARTILAANHDFQLENWKISFSAYSEQDSKNQPLQQQLSTESKTILNQAGDDLTLAVVQSGDSIGYSDNMLLYKKVDSLGYENIYVYSTSSDSAFFQVFFSNVGSGNGDYVKDEYTTFGQSYKWIAPDTLNGMLIHNGVYSPIKQLISPQKRQFLSSSATRIFKHSKLTLNASFSSKDINTFSQKDKADNNGYTGRVFYEFKKNMKDTTWSFQSKSNAEFLSQNFNYIEWFRSVEFDRDWNIRNKNYFGDQYIASEEVSFLKSKHGKIEFGSKYYQIGNDFRGSNNVFKTKWKGKIDADIDASYLVANSDEKSQFIRHKSTISKKINKIKIGYTDIHELNLFYQNDSLQNSSYQFYDYKIFVENADSTKNRVTLFFQNRYNYYNKSNRLNLSDNGTSFGSSVLLNQNKKSVLKWVLTYRKLKIVDSTLTIQKPDENILNRIDHQLKLLKGGIRLSTFYEIGNGLELQKEFIYLEVPAGQGVYTWVDYNNDDVKDINEFELAAYPDQATYIRVYTPSNTYVKTYNNQFSESVSLNPRYFLKAKNQVNNLINRLSYQGVFRSDKKTTNSNLLESYNPFELNVQDSLLQATNSSIRSSVFFNRTNPKFGLEYSYLQTANKQLLVNGFDARDKKEKAIKVRWNITRKYTFQWSISESEKVNLSEYATTRNYSLNNQTANLKLSVQPSTATRISCGVEYKEKRNSVLYGGQSAYLTKVIAELKVNQLKKGSINANVNYILINYLGELNNSVSYEMLESLKPGNNITWNINIVKNLANNLQLSINYIGRKSDENKAIHTGGMQVRAFF